MKILFSILLLFTFTQDVALKKQKLTEYLTIKVHPELRNMTQQELSAKFLGAKIPDAALTERSSAIEFTVTGSPTFWMEKDIALLKEFYDASIPPLFSEVNFTKKDLLTINEQQFAVYEFTGTPVAENASRPPEKRYTYIMYTLFRNGLVTISFSCPPYLQKEWKPIVTEMMKSVQLK